MFYTLGERELPRRYGRRNVHLKANAIKPMPVGGILFQFQSLRDSSTGLPIVKVRHNAPSQNYILVLHMDNKVRIKIPLRDVETVFRCPSWRIRTSLTYWDPSRKRGKPGRIPRDNEHYDAGIRLGKQW